MGYGRRFLASLPPAPVTCKLRRHRSVLRSTCIRCADVAHDAARRRPADPQVGRRQTPAPARAASLLSAPIRPLRRALPRQRRRLPRSATTAGCSTGARCGCRTSTPTSSAATARCATASRRSIAALRALDAGHHRAAAASTSTRCATGASIRARRAVHASSDPEAAYSPELAAMLIYLNRTGYNGLFRLNSRGEFNVPGRALRHRSAICDADNLRAPGGGARRARHVARGRAVRRGRWRRPARRLRLPRSALCAGQPDGALHLVHRLPGSARTSRTAAAAVIELAGRGAHVLLSNSVLPKSARCTQRTPAAGTRA